jgi:serine phosphatase RsbU (regulator of sigma subunit)/anti-sigma regulatory factor (Ser/Thr protein kinase)
LAAAARVSATFPADELTARSARRLLAATLSRWGVDELRDDALLVLSELVTNAVLHAGTAVDVVITLHESAIEVAVVDRHPTRSIPAPPMAVSADREGGRGLALMVRLATAWGVEYTDRTKRVWFRMPLFEGAVRSPGPTIDDAATAAAGVGEPRWSVATVRLDAAGGVQHLDPAAEGLLGVSADEAAGRPWTSFCAEQDAGTLVTAANTRLWQGSYRIIAPDGRLTTVLARHVVLPGLGGAGPTTVIVLVDHRLRVLIGDPGSPPATPRAEGPFGVTPDVLVRLELREVLDRTVIWALEAFDASAAYALLVTDDEAELIVRATAGQPPLRDRRAIPERATAPERYEDLADSPDPDGWLAGTGVRSAMSAPILAGGRLVGSVVVTANRPLAFSTTEATRLQRAVDEVALVVASGRLAEVERRRHLWLGFLAEASDLLAGTLELDMTLALVAQLVTPRLGSWCAIYLADEDRPTEPPHLALVWHGDENRIESLRALLARTGPPAPTGRGIVPWKPPVPVPAAHGSGGGSAADVVPLVARGRILGSLVVGSRPTAGSENPRQRRDLLADLAPRAALALDNARLYAAQSDTSAALQRSLLPPEHPQIAGLQIGVVYEASGEGFQVGGDFYDIVRTPVPAGGSGDHFAFAVGDVCGKGAEAAAVTGLARSALRVLSRRGDDVPDVVADLNAALLAEGDRARFLTAVYGEGCTEVDGSVLLKVASAGHPTPIQVRADGAVTPVPGGGDLLGVFEEPEIVVTQVRLAPGESLVCFTDGVTERRDGERMLGEEGVAHALRGGEHLSAEALAKRLGSVVRDYAAEPPRDDVAILVLRAAPSP